MLARRAENLIKQLNISNELREKPVETRGRVKKEVTARIIHQSNKNCEIQTLISITKPHRDETAAHCILPERDRQSLSCSPCIPLARVFKLVRVSVVVDLKLSAEQRTLIRSSLNQHKQRQSKIDIKLLQFDDLT